MLGVKSTERLLADENRRETQSHLAEHGPVHHHRSRPRGRRRCNRFGLQSCQQRHFQRKHRVSGRFPEGGGLGLQLANGCLRHSQERRGEPDIVHAIHLPGRVRRHKHRYNNRSILRRSVQHHIWGPRHLDDRRALGDSGSKQPSHVPVELIHTSAGRPDIVHPQCPPVHLW